MRRGPRRAAHAATVVRPLAALAAVAALATTAGAQGERPRRGALTLAAGAGTPLSHTADRFCGNAFAVDASAGLRVRVAGLAFLDAATTLSRGTAPSSCVAADERPGDGTHRTSRYERDPDDGAVATALRAGIEGGGDRARARVAAGVGRMWRQPATFGTVALSASLGGRALRLLVEGEQRWYRLAVIEEQSRYESGRLVSTTTSRRRVRERPRTIRAGVDLPLGPRR